MGGSLGKAFGYSGGVLLSRSNTIESFRATKVARAGSIGLSASAAMCAKSLAYAREHPELFSHQRGISSFGQVARKQENHRWHPLICRVTHQEIA